MKKRILLIFAVGISFAPAVFAGYAADDPRALGPKVEQKRAGEDSNPPSGSFVCEFSHTDVQKGFTRPVGGSKSGRASTAGSARSR
jgi:hypothetical protein